MPSVRSRRRTAARHPSPPSAKRPEFFQSSPMEHYLNTTILIHALAVAGPAHAGFTVFDITGAGTKGGQGTYGYGVNVEGTTAGNVIDKQGAMAGYVRGADGAATVFNALPGFETHAIDIARSG